jgi:hypothetical protein
MRLVWFVVGGIIGFLAGVVFGGRLVGWGFGRGPAN